MARPLTAEALRAELKTFLDMRDESVITEEEFANLKQEAIARFQRPPAADPHVP
jgi:predicted Zn-dependent peptidase